MDAEIIRRVRERASGCSEYCRLRSASHPAPFQTDHIIARHHGGSDDLDNLAFACIRCNRHKGPNIAGIDPEIGEIARLFNPRKDEWSRHFSWNGAEIVPLTPVGRVTVAVLFMNDPEVVWLRANLAPENDSGAR